MNERIRLNHRRLARELARSRRSQNAWAAKLGVSKGYLSQLVNGRRRFPSAAVRRRLLEVLDVRPEELFESEHTPASAALRWSEEPPAARSGRPTIHFRHPRGMGDGMLETFVQDLRLSFRMLARQPVVSAIIILVLALGIGANTALFSLVDGILLKPLPYPQPEQLVLLHENQLQRGLTRFGVSPANHADWHDQSSTFSHLAALVARDGNLLTDAEAVRVRYALCSPDLFPLLGVAPRLGRVLAPEDGEVGQDNVLVVSDQFWQRKLGGRRAAVGESVIFDGQPHTVVGVMPPGFHYPSPTVQAWKPLALRGLEAENRSGRWLFSIGRLHDGVALEEAKAEMDAVAGRLAAAFPDSNEGWGVTLTPLTTSVVGTVRSPLLLLWGATGLVLLIACANVAHLLLARGAARRQEVAIRFALGAGRGRLVRQLLTENLLLAVAGGCAGALLAFLAMRLLPAMAAGSLPRLETVTVSGRAFAFALVLAVLTGLLSGLAPALRTSESSPGRGLHGGRMVAGRLRAALVMGEVTLAVVMLVAAGLLLRSLVSVLAVDAGFEPERLLTLRIEPPVETQLEGDDLEALLDRLMAERSRMGGLYEEMLESLAALPGVQSAAAINRGPLTGDSWFFKFSVAGRAPLPNHELPSGLARVTTAGYFQTLGIPLLAGRALAATDVYGGEPVVVIDEEMARRYWPEEDPLGQRITQADVPPEFAARFTFKVVGIVGSVHHGTLESVARPTAYFHLPQATTGHFEDWGMTLMVRTAGDPQELAAMVREEVSRRMPELPVFAVRTMAETMRSTLAGRQFQTRLLWGFAVLALMLSVVGVYGVVAFSVSQRRREMGLRLALGARSRDVLRMILGEGLRPVVAGLVLGALTSLLLGRVLTSLLFGIGATDPVAFLVAAVLLLGAAFLACVVPARRATQVDPALVLRCE